MPRKAISKQMDKKNIYKKKCKKIKLNYSRIFLIGFSIYFIYTFVNQQFRINEYDIQINYLNQTIEENKAKINEIDNLKNEVTESEYLESVARSKLGLVKPYEKIFIDIDR